MDAGYIEDKIQQGIKKGFGATKFLTPLELQEGIIMTLTDVEKVRLEIGLSGQAADILSDGN